MKLSEEYKERIRQRNKIRAKIIGVCMVLVVVGLIIVRIIT